MVGYHAISSLSQDKFLPQDNKKNGVRHFFYGG